MLKISELRIAKRKDLHDAIKISMPTIDRILTGIPHYLLFDRQGNLVDRNAPRPDSEEVRDKIDALLEVM